MSLDYDAVDKLITDAFGEPDTSTGHYMLDSGNLQAFAHRLLATASEANKEAVNRAAEDNADLDWLNERGFSTINMPGVHAWKMDQLQSWFWTAHTISSNYTSCRDAIRAARKAKL